MPPLTPRAVDCSLTFEELLGPRHMTKQGSPAAGATTVEEAQLRSGADVEPLPGCVLFVSNQRPRHEPYRLDASGLTFGRSVAQGVTLDDSLTSREHAHVAWRDGGFVVRDLGSRNGTFVDGKRLHGEVEAPSGSIVRLGGSLLLLTNDVRPLVLDSVSLQGKMVIGPAVREVLRATARAAAHGKTLLVTGETGTGKELVARYFHDQGPRARGPFVVANCGAIPEGVAESLLFGSRRGAFSGAVDAAGIAQRAHGGTLFLDEIAELPLAIQVKLLRLLEYGEVQRVGGDRPEKVDIAICVATWRDLRAEVGAGRFREDLYFRVGRPDVRLPPLRERRYEIPWHVADELGDGIQASAGFIEVCALRPWPGNVRELRAETRRSAALAAEAGRLVVAAEDLDARAGTELGGATTTEPPRDEIARALAEEGGNVTRAARRLGIHRNKVRRWLERHALDPKKLR